MQFGQLYHIRYTVTVLVLLAVACVSSSDLQTENQISFRKVGKIPVVEGRINGKKAYFIIDTGASISVLNQSASAHFGFTALECSDHITGFTGQASLREVKNCIVEIGIIRIRNVSFRTRCLNELMITIRNHEGIEIAGIIGSDVFARYHMTIDFRRSKIFF